MAQMTFSTTGPNDDYVYTASASYPPTPANNRGLDEISADAYKAFTAGNHSVATGLFKWDTSLLPNLINITSATFSATTAASTSPDGRNLLADYYVFDGTISDYTPTGSGSAYSGAISGIAGSTLVTLTLVGDLNANISRTGMTGLRFTISGGAATSGSNNIVQFYSSQNPYSLAAPLLTVNYDIPATTRIAPDAILAQTNLTGAVSAIQDDPDSETGVWLTAP